MKITSVEVTPLVLPNASRGWMGDVRCALVEIRAGDVHGIGVCATSRPVMFASLVSAMTELGAGLVGLNASQPERVHRRLISPENFFGPGGVLTMAASALDTAVWDLFARHAGVPMWQLLGGAADSARTYDSGSLVPSLSLDELQIAAAAAVSRGHRAVKMRPGPDRDGPPAAIAERVAAVRDAVGPDIAVMIDINQGWTAKRSIEIIRLLQPYGLEWVEDPTAMTDFAGQAAVAAAVTTGAYLRGEYFADSWPLLRLLQERAVDILMVDLMRVGGITPFRHVASTASLFGVPVVSHLFPEINAHLIAAAPNGYMVEYMPWTDPLFTEVPALVDGQLLLTDRPGLALDIDRDFVERHRAW